MAELGADSSNAAFVNSSTSSRFSVVQASEAGSIDSFHYFATNRLGDGNTSFTDFDFSVYKNTVNDLDGAELVWSSAQFSSVPSTSAWNTISASGSFEANDYIFFLLRSADGITMYLQTGTPAGDIIDDESYLAQSADVGNPGASFEDPITLTPGAAAEALKAYITYTPSGGGGGSIAAIAHHYKRMKAA